MRRILILAVFLLSGASTLAYDYYVDPVVGSDETGSGTQTAPWLTIQHAFDRVLGSAASPHTIHLAPGVYSRDTNGETGICTDGVWRIWADEYESLVGPDCRRCRVDIIIILAAGCLLEGIDCYAYTGTSSATVRRCLFASRRDGLACGPGTTALIESCVFWNCSTGILSPVEDSPAIRNCVFYGNDIAISDYGGPQPGVSYCLVEGGHPGEGNIDADPLFIAPANGDFRLRWDSPCIDAGDPANPVPPGGGARIDMGVFEYPHQPIPAIVGVVFDDTAGGDSDGIPEVGETILMPVTLTNYGEPAAGLSTTLTFDPPSITVLDDQANFPDLDSGETGGSLPDHFRWVVPADWPVAGPVDMVLTWTSQDGTGEECFALTLNGQEVWVDAAAGDDETGSGSPAAPWRTIRHAMCQVRGTEFQPIEVRICPGTYSTSSNGEVFPIRPGAYESLVGEANQSRPVIDEPSGDYELVEGSRGAELEHLELWRNPNGEAGCGSCILYWRHPLVVHDCTIDRYGDDYGATIFTESGVDITESSIYGAIGAYPAGYFFGNVLKDVYVEHGTVLNNRFDDKYDGGGDLECTESGLVEGNFFAPSAASGNDLGIGPDAIMRYNIVLDARCTVGGADFHHNYFEGPTTYGLLLVGGGMIRNNVLMALGEVVDIPEFGGGIVQNNRIICGGERIHVFMSAPSLTNNTIIDSLGGCVYGVSAWPGGEIRNSIIWTEADDLRLTTATYSCIEDADPGTGNISSEPLLIGVGFSTDLGERTLTDSSASWFPGALGGLLVNPNLQQSELLLVEGNTVDTLFFYDDPRPLASVGDVYLVPDLRLQTVVEGWPANSPCIDTGNPNPAYNDPDGSRNDMGAWGGPWADPGPQWTPAATATPTPTVEPTAPATATPAPSAEPTGSPETPTPTAPPTATPACQELAVELAMPAVIFHPGEPCWLRARVCNPGPPVADVPLFVLLDVYGEYWLAPSWAHWPEGALDGYFFTALAAGWTELEVIAPFVWPERAGSASGLFFHAAITDPAVSTVLGQPASWGFGFE